MCGSRVREVDNSFYDTLGDAWYGDDAHAIAVLRAESAVRVDFVRERLRREDVLCDVGAGAGFLAIPLSEHCARIVAVDRSTSSLRVLRAHDAKGSVALITADGFHLPLPDASIDAVLLMDILEHVSHPAQLIAEAARVLRPGGRVFFHTFNRTLPSWIVVVKAMELFVPKYPRNLHVHRYFITPSELAAQCTAAGLRVEELRGLRPVFDAAFFQSIVRRRVLPAFRFRLTSSLAMGYVGVATAPAR